MLPLIVTVIIDVLGNNIILPLLPALLIQPDVSLLPMSVSEPMRYILYGLCVALWPLGIFLGTPYLSSLSDVYGRKRILILALLGTALSFVLSAVAILLSAFILFALCRFINGFFSGTFSIAQASVSHSSQNYQQKIRRLGWLSFAGTIGAVLGPLLSGYVVGHHPATWRFSLPFAIAAILAFLNITLLYLNFREPMTLPLPMNSKQFHMQQMLQGVYKNIIFIFVDRRIRIYMILFSLLQIGWGAYIQGLPLFLNVNLHLRTAGISTFFMILAISLGIAQVSIRPILTKYMPPLQMFALATFFLAGLTFILPLSKSLLLAYVLSALSVILEMLAYTGILSLFSEAVHPNEQGKVMGGTAAIFGLAWMLSGIFIGPLAAMSVYLPLILTAIFIGLAGIIAFNFRNKPHA